jgi:hypothetical protein
MTIKTSLGRLALASCALLIATATSRAQLSGTDLGATAPTPSPYDISQLLTTGDTIQLQDGGGLNYFYDNTSGGTGYVGTSFTTGGNAGGYWFNSLAVKFGGGGGTGSPGYSGGSDSGTGSGGWVITLYQLSGVGNATATPLSTNTVGTVAGVNSGADWILMSGFTNSLLPNTTYAWTIFQPSGYDDLGYATGTPYGSGAICRIPPGGGAVTYFPTDHDSATFDVGLTLIPSALAITDLGAGINPTPGPNDIDQILTSVGADATAGINYYDNDSDSTSPGATGSSFATGNYSGGYVLNSIAIKFDGSSAGGADTGGSQSWRITLFKLSGAGFTTATPIITNTSVTHTTSVQSSEDWLDFSGFGVYLQPNSQYAYVITTSSSPSYTGYDDLGVYPGLPYTGGAICRIPAGGGGVTYYATDNNSASFDVGISLNGFPGVGAATATPNPVYALSHYLVLQDTGTGPAPLTFQWQTDGGSGGALTNIPGATGLSYTNIPANAVSTYVINYDFVVANGAGSVTSAVVPVTVFPATAPIITQDTSPTNLLTTYVGGTATFSAAFDGTQPITYQWYANTNGSNQALAGQTNTTLTLTNLLASAAGTYQLRALNSQGSTFSTATTLSFEANPPDYPPVPAHKYDYEIYTNGPFAYWRLNETANPATSSVPVLAFDYSGHGIYPTYGTAVVTGDNGPQAPIFPGFETTNLAADTSLGANGYLTVPPLNLNTNTVTFVCWINPNGVQPASVGLLFARGGTESAAGFGFNSANNGAGTMPQLGYTWNNNASGTWGWNSGLYPIPNQWNFVAYVLTPTNLTAYLGYVDTNADVTNFSQSVNVLNHQNETMDGGIVSLGADSQQNREFQGTLDEAALFNKALSPGEILKLFQTGFGVATIAPSPATIVSQSVYSGAHVTLGGAAGGSQPITYQWQSAVTGSGLFSNLSNSGNVSGATSPTLTISGVTAANALDYRQICLNSAGSATGSVATITVTPVPSGGLWTVDFQMTNNVLGFATSTNGLGQFAGAGVLGTGTYWNPIPDLAGSFGGGTYTSASDLRDDGVTHSGIYATVSGEAFSSAVAPGSPTAVTTLLDQYLIASSGLTLQGVPDGTYNIVLYGIDGSFHDKGATFTVHGANGDQSASVANVQDGYFSPGDNSWLFTNVQVAGGTLLTDIGAYHGEAEFNGVQLQLLSYASTLNSTVLTNVFSSVNGTVTLSWPEGTLQTSTNLLGPWTTITLAPPFSYTTATSQKQQYFRLKLQ